MLVLTRKTGEEIQIGPTITVKVLRTWRNRTKLGISAPPEVPLVRGELTSRLGRVPADARGARDELAVCRT